MTKQDASMTTPIRWGILGAARVNERLLPAIVESHNAELVAIASRRPGAAAETLKKYAPQCSSTRCYDQLEALIHAEDIQAIYIPMANEEHTEWALKAIEAGKHVLIEKPLAITVADIQAIESAAARKGVKVMEGFMYLFHPQHTRVQELVKSGLIGEVKYVRTAYSFLMRAARMYRVSRPPEQGGGAMWDIGPYAIHSLRLWFNHAPKSLMAMAQYNHHGADIAATGILDFGEGRYGHFDIGFERSRRSEYEITGDKGSIKCHTVWQLPGDVPRISWATEDGRRGEEQLLPANHFKLEIEHFSDCILNDQPPMLSLHDAKMNCRVIQAVLDSAKSGKKADLGHL
jgi:xylose dehydrogenase (NAD/NADP)